MKQALPALALLSSALVLCGCGGRARRERAAWLAKWVGSQAYSSWSTFRRATGQPHQPQSPDGLTLGSPQVFAGIGCSVRDLSSLDVFWADENTTRAVSRSVTVSVRTGGGEASPLAAFPDQTLRRVRHTAIAVSRSESSNLTVTSVDFAPMGPQDSFLVRWLLVENVGRRTLRVELSLDVLTAGRPARRSSRAWQLGDKLALVSDAKLVAGEDAVRLPLGRLGPGAETAAAVLFVGARDAKRLSSYMAVAEATLTRLPEVLEETRKNWEQWCARSSLGTGDQRTDDLLDSLLCLVRSHVGREAIHTGSLKYAHNRAWIRDNYWVQRTLLELGYNQEAQASLDFFYRAWRKSKTASYYGIPDGLGGEYGYDRVELPHYLVLMVRDAEQLAGVDGGRYWEMVKGCLDEAAVGSDYLQPMNGDETWLLAAPVRELDSLLDNQWLLIASAEYAARLAQRMKDTQRAARYGSIAYRARLALTRFQPKRPPGIVAPASLALPPEAPGPQPAGPETRAASGGHYWYALGLGGDGSLDLSLSPGVLARGALLGVLPASDSYLERGMVASWDRLNFARGIRAHSRSCTIDGGTPGYLLYAAADDTLCDYLFARELARRVLSFASATGCVWEYHDLHDPAWGGEKRRLWDSAVLLLGLVHALFDGQRVGSMVTFVPRGSPSAVAVEAEPPPLFDAAAAQELANPASRAVILDDASPKHAARIARELLRQTNRLWTIQRWPGRPPDDRPAIIVSRSAPEVTWAQSPAGYWVRQWDGPPQVWVQSNGGVWLDTEPLLVDLLSFITPQRQAPMSFPDADLDLAARFGEEPSGRALVAASAGSAVSWGFLDMSGARTSLNAGQSEVEVALRYDGSRRVTELRVSAQAPRPNPVEADVTLPPGWWLVRARDMTGRWDRVEDPVRQFHLPEGGTRLHYSFRQGADPVYLTFELAKLQVSTLP
jgi:hypothetical protein